MSARRKKTAAGAGQPSCLITPNAASRKGRGRGVDCNRSATAAHQTVPSHEAAPSGVTLRRGLGIGSGVRDALGGAASPSLRVFIPWLAPSFNKVWAGMHWAARKRIAEEGHLIVKTKLRGAPKLTPPVVLIFQPVHPQGRRYDALNYALSAKVIEDGLVRSGLLSDDSGAYVAGVVLLRAQRGPETGVWLEAVEVEE